MKRLLDGRAYKPASSAPEAPGVGVGVPDDSELDGVIVGCPASSVGVTDGVRIGVWVGVKVGASVGVIVGTGVGVAVGAGVSVGASVGVA
ncbi:MAG: hypothetical protein J7463_07355, partial [Roseiflexus sp.]|nr:hypothetical protein [Roseiflexus sp.]MBO9334433.1 hypothetical protein [Roseiflexus sp.]MBO9364736.1 hypothetical protein [Roseiflexus sp.]MBO9383473.1 hypothetical protein [Roseiflexus sp.]MBO9389014.1 hypothetical protein [Roseiflexus sp.]